MVGFFETPAKCQARVAKANDLKKITLVKTYYHGIERLNNQIFLYAYLLKEVVGRKAKAMTSRLLIGKYFHAITFHAAIMYRLVSGKAANSEEEEHIFQTLKISNNTSNHHHGHVLINNMIGLQAREEFNPHKVGKEKSSMNLENYAEVCQKKLILSYLTGY